jgi:serine protease
MILRILVVIVIFLSSLAHAQVSEELQPSRLRWLVQFSENISDAEISNLAREWGADVVDPGPFARHHRVEFDFPPSRELVRSIRARTIVRIFEQEVRYTTTASRKVVGSNDPLRKQQWSLDAIRLSDAHMINFGADPYVTIAILDTGIANPETFSNEQTDFEGTIIYPGFDFVSGDAEPLDEGDGEIGHGTMMASIIALTSFNMHGAASIAFNASLLPVRVVNRRGLAFAGDVARGIRYSVANGATVIVLGFTGPLGSEIVHEALVEANEKDVAIIAPAGNSLEVGYPAASPYVIGVGALDAAGRPAYYSPEVGQIDIYAPGGDARAGIDANGDGLPDGVLVNTFEVDSRSNAFLFVDGTSVAAAHVAGVAALTVSSFGRKSSGELYRVLTQGSNSEELKKLDAFIALRPPIN